MRRIAAALAFLVCLGVYANDSAAQDDETKTSNESVRNVLDSANGLSQLNGGQVANVLENFLGDPEGSMKSFLGNPETLNRALKTFTDRDSGLAKIFKDIDFKFKTFNTQKDDDFGVGFSYAFDKAIFDHDLNIDCDACVTALDLRVVANGNVAFNKGTNPRDFLETKLSLAGFHSRGGVKKLSEADQLLYNQYTDREVDADTMEELDEILGEEAGFLRGKLTDQFYVEFAADVSFESNQDFSQTQFVYSGRLGFEVMGWGDYTARSLSDSPLSAKLNFIDYPFALIRMLSGYSTCSDDHGTETSTCFLPRGTSLPSVAVGVGFVDPQDAADPRGMVGDRSSFPRLTPELSFKTPVARAFGNEVYFAANYRFYHEIAASAAVKAANLDSYHYVAVVLGPQVGPYFSYSAGRLPFDSRNDQVVELGLKYNF